MTEQKQHQKIFVKKLCSFLFFTYAVFFFLKIAEASSVTYQVNEPTKQSFLNNDVTCMMAVEPENFLSKRTKLVWRKTANHQIWVKKAKSQKLNCGVGKSPFKLSQKGNRIGGGFQGYGLARCSTGNYSNCYGYKFENDTSLSIGEFAHTSENLKPGFFWDKNGVSFFGVFSLAKSQNPVFSYNESFVGFQTGHLFAQGFDNNDGGTLFFPDGTKHVISFNNLKKCTQYSGNINDDCIRLHYEFDTGFQVGLIKAIIIGDGTKRMLNGIGLLALNSEKLEYGLFEENILLKSIAYVSQDSTTGDRNVVVTKSLKNSQPSNFSKSQSISSNKPKAILKQNENLDSSLVKKATSNNLRVLCETLKNQILSHVEEQDYTKAQEATQLMKTMECNVSDSPDKSISPTTKTEQRSKTTLFCNANLKDNRGRVIKTFNATAFDSNISRDCSVAVQKCNRISLIQLKHNGVPKKSRTYKKRCDIFGECTISETNSSSGGGFAAGFFEGLNSVAKEKEVLAQFFEVCMIDEGYNIN